MIPNLLKNQYRDPGSSGLPEDYPVPPQNDSLLFYIQRNHNLNTVVYELNYLASGDINQDYPMHSFWIRYNSGGDIAELNYYQNKLAYGYQSRMLAPDSFEFTFVSYKDLKLYIGAGQDGKFGAHCKINQQMSKLTNIYVYAEEFGVFPNVKFIELYGLTLDTGESAYERINIDL